MKTPKTKSPKTKTSKAKTPKTKIPKVAKTVEGLIAQVRKATKGGNYIFRGENKNYGIISSKLYRYFQSIGGQAILQENKITFNFDPIKQTLESQLEIPLKKHFGKNVPKLDFDAIEKSLKENILVQLAQKINYPFNVESLQKEFILKDVQEYVDFEKEIDTLAALQHYGGSTNLIDFSHDLAVALFFACDGEPEEDGRLIVLSADAEGVIPPKKNQNNRIVFQKSIFVQRKNGYIEEQDDKIKEFIVPKNLKKLTLIYVQNYFGIRTETIYGDLVGYIQNQERHSEAYKRFFVGAIYDKYYSVEGFEKAINCYKEATKLKPNLAQAHNNLGIAKIKLSPLYLKEAIDDFSKAIEANPNYIEAYNNRGAAYGDMKNHIPAIANFNKAIALNPNYAEAYEHRGLSQKELDNYKEAKEDYEIALRLAEEQEKQYLVDRIRGRISDLLITQIHNLPPAVPPNRN